MTDNIREKIKKLLALAADGSNEHESARAMELATALMMRHNISQDEFKEKAKPTTGLGKNFFEDDLPWHKSAAAAAGVLYACRPIWYGDKFTFVGREDNIEAAEITYEFIRRQVETLYKTNLPRGMSQRDRAIYRKEFKLSCAARVYTRARMIVDQLKADDAKAIAATGSTALVIVEARKQLDMEVAAFMNSIGTRIAKPRGIMMGRSSGTNDGYRAGDQVKLNQQVR